MSYSNRIFFYGPVGLLLLVVGAYCVFWRVQADTLAARLDARQWRRDHAGHRLRLRREIGRRLPVPARRGALAASPSPSGAQGETAWRTENLALHMLSYGPSHFIFEAAGLQSFAWPGANGATRVFYVTPSLARASAILRDGRLARFDLDVIGFDVQDADPSIKPGSSVTVGRAQFHLREKDDHTLDVAIKVENASIGPGYQPALGPDLPLITLTGSISHGETLDALLAGVGSFADGAEAWRKSNGAFDVSDLTIDWSDVEWKAKGSLAFNAGHRPTGEIAGLVTGGQVLKTTALVSIYTGTEPDAQGHVPATLTFQNGEMRLGKTLLETLTPAY